MPKCRSEQSGRRQRAGVVACLPCGKDVFAVWCWRNTDDEDDDGDSENGSDNGSVLVVGPYGRRDQARFQQTVGYLLNMVVYKYEVGSQANGRNGVWPS